MSYLSDSVALCTHNSAMLNHAVCNYMLMIRVGSVWLFTLAWGCLQTENCHRGSVVSFSLGEALFDGLSESGAHWESKYFFCLLFTIHKIEAECLVCLLFIDDTIGYEGGGFEGHCFTVYSQKQEPIWLLWVWPVYLFFSSFVHYSTPNSVKWEVNEGRNWRWRELRKHQPIPNLSLKRSDIF